MEYAKIGFLHFFTDFVFAEGISAVLIMARKYEIAIEKCRIILYEFLSVSLGMPTT